MKKQYTVEETYGKNITLKFYIDGKFQKEITLYDYVLLGYIRAKEEDGWERAHSSKEINEIIEEIKNLEVEIEKKRKQLEEIKNNLIGE